MNNFIKAQNDRFKFLRAFLVGTYNIISESFLSSGELIQGLYFGAAFARLWSTAQLIKRLVLSRQCRRKPVRRPVPVNPVHPPRPSCS